MVDPTTTTESCEGAEPVPPTAADGSPAEIVATAGPVSFAVVDRGASVDVLAVLATVDCALTPVGLDGSPASLAVGGSVTHGDGIRCNDDGTLTVLSATSDDGATYQATSVTYELDGEGPALVEVDRAVTTIDAAAEADALSAYYRLDC
jgi:hypothetical protein